MNPLRALSSWRESRRIRGHMRELRALSGNGGYVPAAPVLSGTYVTPDTAMGLSAVFAAVNLISGDIAMLPTYCCKKLPDGGREIDDKHWLHPLLTVSPDGGETDHFRFNQSSMSHTLTRGNGYCELSRNKRDGRVESYHLLHPVKTVPKQTADGTLYYQLVDGAGNTSGKETKLPAEDVLHFAGLGFNGIQGYSPLTLNRQTLGLAMAVEQYGGAYFGNSGIPKGILKTAKKLSEAAVSNLRMTFNAIHQGSQNAHQLMVLEEGLEWIKTEFSPEDGQFLLTRAFQVKEVARIFGVPPHKLGDYSDAHESNVEESNLDYVSMTIARWIVMREAQMNLKLLTAKDRETHCICTDLSALMRGNSAARIAYYQGMRNMGAVNADEIRRKEGFNPIGPKQGGDLYIVQGQYLPLNQIGKSKGVIPPSDGNPPKPTPPQTPPKTD